MEQRVEELEKTLRVLHNHIAHHCRQMTTVRQELVATNEFLHKLKYFVEETLEDRDALLKDEFKAAIAEQTEELFEHVNETFKIFQSLENESD